ncbi:MAG: phage portal protein, partial [Methyloligellaceae bacterium]
MEWLTGSLVGEQTSAGVRVGEETALSLPALFCALNLMSSIMATLPWPVYRRLPDGGREQDREHPVHGLLNLAANDRVTAAAFRRSYHLQLMLHGTARAEITNDGRGDLRML